jgi:hypothetical protein
MRLRWPSRRSPRSARQDRGAVGDGVQLGAVVVIAAWSGALTEAAPTSRCAARVRAASSLTKRARAAPLARACPGGGTSKAPLNLTTSASFAVDPSLVEVLRVVTVGVRSAVRRPDAFSRMMRAIYEAVRRDYLSNVRVGSATHPWLCLGRGRGRQPSSSPPARVRKRADSPAYELSERLNQVLPQGRVL